MPDLYPDTRCASCGRAHTLYRTDDGPHAPGELFAYTCPATDQVVRVWWLRLPEAAPAVPQDAIPMRPASD